MQSITVLLTGCGAPGAPGIIKCLRKNGERNIRIVGVDINENAGGRNLVDAFYVVPKASDDNFILRILDICKKESVDVIEPIVTRELMKFAVSKQLFEAAGIKVAVMNPETLDIVNNKAHLFDAMKKAGLAIPDYIVVNTLDELIDACKVLGYPHRAICVKGAVGNGSRGVRIVDSSISKYDLFFNEKPNSMYISYDELIRTLSEKPTIPEMLVMEYLPGTEYSVDFLADKGKDLYAVSRKALSVVTSNMMSLEIDNNYEVIGLCSNIVKELNLSGNFGFDLKYGYDDKPYIIEINPRLTAGVVSCAASGVNLPYLGIKYLLGEPLPKCNINYGMRMSRRYLETFFDKEGKVIEW